MTSIMFRSAASLLTLVMLAGFGACSSMHDEEAAIGRAIAGHLDPLNGLPTAVLQRYRCQSAEGPCDLGSSRGETTVLAAAFAEAQQIPVLRSEETVAPLCEWTTERDAPRGLWAEFVYPPQIQGDSARVLLATGCAAGEAFEQIHEFVLRRHGQEWIVEHRSLQSIT
jgi:hypothetical protein